jgi:hypothetical protein
MKEWVIVPLAYRKKWRGLAEQAWRYVGG